MGMDMEREERDLSAIRRRIVSPEEAEGDLTEAWCVKEAYVKKTGEGLIVPFPSLTAKDGKLYSPRGTAFYKTGALCGDRYALCADVPFERSVLRVNAREAVRAIDEAGERPAFETVTVTVDRPLGAVHPSHAGYSLSCELRLYQRTDRGRRGSAGCVHSGRFSAAVRVYRQTGRRDSPAGRRRG